jgi:anti-sigma factor ChrR (cupin superfamily)
VAISFYPKLLVFAGHQESGGEQRAGRGIPSASHAEASQFTSIDNPEGTALASQLTSAPTPSEIAAAEETMADTSSQIIRVNDLEWTSMASALKAKALWSDPGTKRRALLTRFEPGATLPTHRHVGDELLYVIEGSIADEHGTTTTGNVGYRPNGCIHSVTSKNGATVLAIVSGGIEPATDLTGAPRSQNFDLSEIAWTEAMPGVRQKPIWHDKETKRRAALVRFDPGAQLPRHKHVGDELIFVIEGSNADESGEVVAGNANYRPNGCTHTVSTRNGATIFALVTGGVEMMK